MTTAISKPQLNAVRKSLAKIDFMITFCVLTTVLSCNGVKEEKAKEDKLIKEQTEQIKRNEESISDKKETIENLEQENSDLKQEKERILIEKERSELSSNLNSYFEIIPQYTALDLGGIENAYLILRNNYKYNLHDISITISYVKANGDVFKVEAVDVGSVAPNESHSVVLPSSPRGVSLRTNLVRIYCDKIGFQFNTGAKAY